MDGLALHVEGGHARGREHRNFFAGVAAEIVKERRFPVPAFPVMNTWRLECSMRSRAFAKSALISIGVFVIPALWFFGCRGGFLPEKRGDTSRRGW